MARAILTKGLLMHGYPDEAAAAILIHYGNFGHASAKEAPDIQIDIERLIGKYRAVYPADTITLIGTYPAKHAQPLPEIKQPKRGRPTALSIDQYMDYISQEVDCGTIMKTQEQIATALKVSKPTIERIERQLRQHGVLKRQVIRKGRSTYSYLVILSAIKNTPVQPQPEAPTANYDDTQQVIALPQTCDPELLSVEHTGGDETAADPAPVPTGELPPSRVSLADAVRAAMHALRAEGHRLSVQRVEQWLRTYLPEMHWTRSQIRRFYTARLTHEQQQGSAAYFDRLAAMTVTELQRALKAIDRRIGAPSPAARRSRAQLLTHRQHLEAALQRKLAASKQTRQTQASLPMELLPEL